jgi:hypothetical protein
MEKTNCKQKNFLIPFFFNFGLLIHSVRIQFLPSFALIIPKSVFNSHKQERDKKPKTLE